MALGPAKYQAIEAEWQQCILLSAQLSVWYGQAEAAAAEAAQTHAAGKGIQDLSVSRESQQSTSGVPRVSPVRASIAHLTSAIGDANLSDLVPMTEQHHFSIGPNAVTWCAEYLLDNLDSWKDFSQPPRLFAIPPKPTLIAMRPFLLDTAQGFIVPPSLEHRLSTKQKPGMVASLFGWRK